METEPEKAIRKNFTIEQADVDILEFFKRKGVDASSTVRTALRHYYEWFGTKATQGGAEDSIQLS